MAGAKEEHVLASGGGDDVILLGTPVGGRVPRRARSLGVAWGVLGGALALSCGGGSLMDPVDAPPEVAAVRLFAGAADYTDHLFLVEGQTLRLEVRLYAANGDRIEAAATDFDVTFTFSPDSFATAKPVDGTPFVQDVTPVARSGTPGALRVLCDHRRLMFIKQFGPFDALVH